MNSICEFVSSTAATPQNHDGAAHNHLILPANMENNTMYGLEFSMAKLAHQQWKFKLRSFLDGVEPMNVSEAVSHKDCDFGKWLYSEGGLEQFGSFPEMPRLEKVHTDLHQAVRQVVELQNAGNKDQAEHMYEQVVNLSHEVTDLLDDIMKKTT